MAKKVNYLAATESILEEVKAIGGRVFYNDHFSIIINSNPVRSNFIRLGEIYHVCEPRIIIVLEGSCEASIDLEDYHMEKGAVIMSRTDIIHEIKHCSDDLIVAGIIFREGADIHDNCVVQAPPADFDRLLRTLYLLWDMANVTPFQLDTVRHLLSAMVCNIKHLHDAVEHDANRPRPTRQQELFIEFKHLVSRHCDCERGIPFYAGQLRITPHHLSAVIKDVSGQSVMWWVNRAVIQRAKVLLRTSGLMTFEVAERLGFQSASSFINFFKRETGMTPGQFRKEIKEPHEYGSAETCLDCGRLTVSFDVS